jgi:hypothetical protein
VHGHDQGFDHDHDVDRVHGLRGMTFPSPGEGTRYDLAVRT